ncbi:MAG: hypothetical protein BZY82_04455 [SAR202 cluster bacterium Io17-Chloro-G3]|nr:MAG: hypothetical protein BZY82_04455 [SAR202 cluster bacterium Io17-Chloro-G3]
MQRLIIRRAIGYVPTILFVTMFVFSFLLLLPLEPTALLVGTEEGATPERLEKFRKELGYDKPIPVQYVRWVKGVFTGDWGRSLRTRERITVELRNRMVPTLELAIGSWLVTILVALPVGIYSAARPNTVGDNTGTVFAIAGVALPNFWFAILMIYLFGVILGWLPTNGYVSPWVDPVENLRRMIMPVIVAGTSSVASIMRQTRSAMLEVLREDYVRTAHAKGLSEQKVLIRHALRNGLIPVVTIMGFQIANLLGGAAVVETIFNIPGLGQFAIQGAILVDIPVVQGVLLVFGTSVVLVNFGIDILYAFLDPRVRYT